jgi:hypothetical protein
LLLYSVFRSPGCLSLSFIDDCLLIRHILDNLLQNPQPLFVATLSYKPPLPRRKMTSY